jgi:hypothetical protein
MRNCFVGSLLRVGAVVAFSLSLFAQTPARPDLSGIWNAGGFSTLQGPGIARPDSALGGVPGLGFTNEEAPLQPWALAVFKARREGRVFPEPGHEEIDPIMYPYCMPHAFPRVYATPNSVEILQTQDRVYMLFETNRQMRRIYLDGRRHLEGWPRTPMGISYGKWDRDTLVVETENLLSLNNQGWLDGIGHPYTDSLRVTERIRRLNRDTMQIDFTFDDPGAYTKPWAGKRVLQLHPDWEMTEANYCAQHQQEDFLRDMRDGKPAGRP